MHNYYQSTELKQSSDTNRPLRDGDDEEEYGPRATPTPTLTAAAIAEAAAEGDDQITSTTTTTTTTICSSDSEEEKKRRVEEAKSLSVPLYFRGL